jgi:hypothetical protein
VDQLGGDTCHHYKGDMWHVCTAGVARLYDDTWQGMVLKGKAGGIVVPIVD